MVITRQPRPRRARRSPGSLAYHRANGVRVVAGARRWRCLGAHDLHRHAARGDHARCGSPSRCSPALSIVKPLRRAVVTGPIFGIYKKILPQISQTEQEALDAGSIWWDADLFSGKPDWAKLLAIRSAKLSAEEQRIHRRPGGELCGMLDEWDITHNRMDLPPEVWKFIREKGFLGIIIPKSYGGLGFSAFAHSEIVHQDLHAQRHGGGDGDGAQLARARGAR